MSDTSARLIVQGVVRTPGDKSISHRSLIFAALANGESRIRHILESADVQATRNALRALGVALPYALANAMFGGTAEYVALKFKDLGIESGFYIYASVIMAFGFLVVLTMPDTRRHSRIQED